MQKAKGKGGKQKKHIPSNAHPATTQSDNSEDEATDELIQSPSNDQVKYRYNKPNTSKNFCIFSH